jgi:N-acetylmuramoyl-L-alanine amidase/type II secretory pathway predicted ATPase ExeA
LTVRLAERATVNPSIAREVASMFLEFFDLHAQPFGVTPDPAYLYPSQTHCEALDALTEGIQSGRGFLALVAEPGMGKTTLLYQVLDALRDKARTAFLFQTQCSSREFFQYLLSELGTDSTGMGLVAMHNKLNEILFAEMLAGRRFVLVVDEAQNLDETVLETIRLLSNFETTNTKLLQIVLAGQPQLGEKLKQKQLAQLLQRLTVVKHLAPFSLEETSGYIRHRLKVAGYHGEEIFSSSALELIARMSQGIPRNINRICYQSLMDAHADGQRVVSAEVVERADRKLELGARSSTPAAVAPASANVTTEPATTARPQPPQDKRLTVVRSRGWHIWSGIFMAVLLAAMGLGKPTNGRIGDGAQPRSIAREGSASVGERKTAPAELAPGSAQAEGVDYRLQTQGIGDPDPPPALAPLPSHSGMVDVNSIQVSSTANDARVTVLLDGAVPYNSARITGPERIYFDLHNARLSHSVGPNAIPLETGLVKWVRAAQNTDDVVRLVLDASGAKAYSAQMLPDPYRLVIEVHSQAAGKGSLDAQSAIAHASWNPTDSGGAAARPTLSRALGLKISRIVIDPGHGGFDIGAMGPHGLLEKNLCLDVALRLGKLIEEKIPGAEVIYTRKDDTYVPLQERTAIANKAHADLFISIHANSSDSAEARGVETYYLSLAASPEAMKLAARENALGGLSLHDLPELIQKITRNEEISESRQLAIDVQQALAGRLELVSRSETNRGVKRAPFVVLTGAKMPAVLSEISFLSNAKDERLLLQSSQRERIAEGLYSGVAAYLDSLNSLPHAPQELVSENGPAGSAANSTR